MKTLDELKAARDQYLEDHPNLKAYQEEIDDLLDRVPAEHRAEVLSMLMHERLKALGSALEKLSGILPVA
jgi:hypothetical protein